MAFQGLTAYVASTKENNVTQKLLLEAAGIFLNTLYWGTEVRETERWPVTWSPMVNLGIHQPLYSLPSNNWRVQRPSCRLKLGTGAQPLPSLVWSGVSTSLVRYQRSACIILKARYHIQWGVQMSSQRIQRNNSYPSWLCLFSGLDTEYIPIASFFFLFCRLRFILNGKLVWFYLF